MPLVTFFTDKLAIESVNVPDNDKKGLERAVELTAAAQKVWAGKRKAGDANEIHPGRDWDEVGVIGMRIGYRDFETHAQRFNVASAGEAKGRAPTTSEKTAPAIRRAAISPPVAPDDWKIL